MPDSGRQRVRRDSPVSDETVEALGVPTDGMIALEERYDDTPAIPAHVLALA